MLADSTPERKFIANLAKNDLWPCANRGTIFPGLMANDEDHSCRAELHNLLSTNVSTTNGRPFPYPIAKNFVVNAWLVNPPFLFSSLNSFEVLINNTLDQGQFVKILIISYRSLIFFLFTRKARFVFLKEPVLIKFILIQLQSIAQCCNNVQRTFIHKLMILELSLNSNTVILIIILSFCFQTNS